MPGRQRAFLCYVSHRMGLRLECGVCWRRWITKGLITPLLIQNSYYWVNLQRVNIATVRELLLSSSWWYCFTPSTLHPWKHTRQDKFLICFTTANSNPFYHCLLRVPLFTYNNFNGITHWLREAPLRNTYCTHLRNVHIYCTSKQLSFKSLLSTTALCGKEYTSL